jgi:hypothetical protein
MRGFLRFECGARFGAFGLRLLDGGLREPEELAESIDLRVYRTDLFFQVHAGVVQPKRRDFTGCSPRAPERDASKVVTKCTRGNQLLR